MFSFWKGEYYIKKNLLWIQIINIREIHFSDMCRTKNKPLWIHWIHGGNSCPIHADSQCGRKILKPKGQFVWQIKRNLVLFLLLAQCVPKCENLIWNRGMTMFQSRDWEILQETIFHVAVSIKSNIGKKNNFASVLFLLFLDYKQSIWKHNMNDFEQFCQPTCCLGERLLP